MVQCTRRVEFDAGHRIIGHQGQCKYVHGHRYVLEVTVSSELDEMGMVEDFGNLKKIIKSWIDANFDHTLILHEEDREMGENIAIYTGQKIYYLDTNPTAENIALHLKNKILPLLFSDKNLKPVKLRLYETPNCYVEV